MKMNKIFSLLLSVFFTIAFYGCPFDMVHIDQTPVQYKNTSTKKSGFELKDEVNIILETGYSRKLKKGTKSLIN